MARWLCRRPGRPAETVPRVQGNEQERTYKVASLCSYLCMPEKTEIIVQAVYWEYRLSDAWTGSGSRIFEIWTDSRHQVPAVSGLHRISDMEQFRVFGKVYLQLLSKWKGVSTVSSKDLPLWNSRSLKMRCAICEYCHLMWSVSAQLMYPRDFYLLVGICCAEAWQCCNWRS